MERKMFGHRIKRRHEEDEGEDQIPGGTATQNPSNYEGREHMHYDAPGYSSHHIRYPQDEPHMKSRVDREEKHEMEDDYHMDVPDQSERTLPAKIKRAHMKMDQPDQEEPDRLMGQIVHNVGVEGEMDTTGEQEYGPNDMQSDRGGKEHRKKMIMHVMKRKMKKRMMEE